MNNRKIISKDALSEWLTSKVSSHVDCQGTKVSVQYKLKEPDSEGCNWSDTVIFNPGPDADKSTLSSIVCHVVKEARDKFNIE